MNSFPFVDQINSNNKFLVQHIRNKTGLFSDCDYYNKQSYKNKVTKNKVTINKVTIKKVTKYVNLQTFVSIGL